MKKNLFKICAIGLLTLCCSSLSDVAIVGLQNQNRNDLIVSTEDVFNDKLNIAKLRLNKAAVSKKLNCSQIYTQTGYDGSNYYLRFATAVKGDLNSITYSADVLNDSSIVIEDKQVYTVYKSIAANGKSFYHNGRDLINEKLTSTRDYYWACFTIKYTEDSVNKDKEIKVDINVNNGEYTATTTASLNSVLNGGTSTTEYSLGEYIKNNGLPEFEYSNTVHYNIEFKNSEGTVTSNYEITQGACTDGKYLYFVLNDNGTTGVNDGTGKNSAGYVVKYDVSSNKEVDKTPLIGGWVGNHNNGTGNANLFYNPNDGMIYLLGGVKSGGNGGACPDWKINPNDMSVTKLGNEESGEIREEDGFKFVAPDASEYFSNWSNITYDIENLEYNSSLQRWAVVYRVNSNGSGIKEGNVNVFRRLFFYNSDFTLCTDAKQNTIVNYVKGSTTIGIQEMSSDSKYVYLDYTAWGVGNKSQIRMFDWSGNEYDEITLSHNFVTNTGNSNVQFVQAINGDLYVGAYQASIPSGLYLTRVKYLEKPESSEDDHTPSLNYGELAEYCELNNGDLTLTNELAINGILGTSTSAEDGLLGVMAECYNTNTNIPTGTYLYNGSENGAYQWVSEEGFRFWAAKSSTSDGEHIYVLLNADISGDNKGQEVGVIAKYTLDGECVGRTKFTFKWGTNPRLSYLNGKIIVTRTSAASTSTFTKATSFNGKTLEFDTELNYIGEFTPEAEVHQPANAKLDIAASSPDGTKEIYVYQYKDANNANVRDLYIYERNEEGKLVSVLNKPLYFQSISNGAVSGAISSVYGNDSYFYVMFNTATNPIIQAYDYNGKQILTNKTITNIAEGTASSKGYGGIFEINSELYYSVQSWGSNPRGQIYKIKTSHNLSSLVNVTYDTNGAGSIDGALVQKGNTVPRPLNPKYSYTDSNGKTYNFVLENWYHDEKVWDFDTDVVTEDITLKAKWTFEDSFFAVKANAHIRANNTTARVMSFNVLADDWNNKPAVDDTRANQAFNTIERYAPDVVGLQEFDDQWYSKASTLLNGYKVINAENNKPFGATNYSTLAYNTSKVKVVEYTQKALTTNNNPNVCRNVTIGVFEFISGENVGKQFIVTSTHFDVNNITGQTTQAGELANIAKELETKYPSLPIILTGDYNTNEGTTPYNKFMSESGCLDAKNAETKGLVCKTTHIGNGMLVGDKVVSNPNHWLRGPVSFLPVNVMTTLSIDHIFTSTNVKSLYYDTVVDTDALNASDHCPIYCDLKF